MQRDQQRDAEGQRGPAEDEPDHDQSQRGGAGGDRDGQQGAEIEVLQRVDVVDGAAQEITAAPPDQGRGHARGDSRSYSQTRQSGQRAQGGVVADEAFGVAQRST